MRTGISKSTEHAFLYGITAAAGWLWDNEAGQWVAGESPEGWRWDEDLGEWVAEEAPEGWEWDEEKQEWVAVEYPGWKWDEETGEWVAEEGAEEEQDTTGWEWDENAQEWVAAEGYGTDGEGEGWEGEGDWDGYEEGEWAAGEWEEGAHNRVKGKSKVAKAKGKGKGKTAKGKGTTKGTGNVKGKGKAKGKGKTNVKAKSRVTPGKTKMSQTSQKDSPRKRLTLKSKSEKSIPLSEAVPETVTVPEAASKKPKETEKVPMKKRLLQRFFSKSKSKGKREVEEAEGAVSSARKGPKEGSHNAPPMFDSKNSIHKDNTTKRSSAIGEDRSHRPSRKKKSISSTSKNENHHAISNKFRSAKTSNNTTSNSSNNVSLKEGSHFKSNQSRLDSLSKLSKEGSHSQSRIEHEDLVNQYYGRLESHTNILEAKAQEEQDEAERLRLKAEEEERLRKLAFSKQMRDTRRFKQMKRRLFETFLVDKLPGPKKSWGLYRLDFFRIFPALFEKRASWGNFVSHDNFSPAKLWWYWDGFREVDAPEKSMYGVIEGNSREEAREYPLLASMEAAAAAGKTSSSDSDSPDLSGKKKRKRDKLLLEKKKNRDKNKLKEGSDGRSKLDTSLRWRGDLEFRLTQPIDWDCIEKSLTTLKSFFRKDHYRERKKYHDEQAQIESDSEQERPQFTYSRRDLAQRVFDMSDRVFGTRDGTRAEKHGGHGHSHPKNKTQKQNNEHFFFTELNRAAGAGLTRGERLAQMARAKAKVHETNKELKLAQQALEEAEKKSKEADERAKEAEEEKDKMVAQEKSGTVFVNPVDKIRIERECRVARKGADVAGRVLFLARRDVETAGKLVVLWGGDVGKIEKEVTEGHKGDDLQTPFERTEMKETGQEMREYFEAQHLAANPDDTENADGKTCNNNRMPKMSEGAHTMGKDLHHFVVRNRPQPKETAKKKEKKDPHDDPNSLESSFKTSNIPPADSVILNDLEVAMKIENIASGKLRDASNFGDDGKGITKGPGAGYGRDSGGMSNVDKLKMKDGGHKAEKAGRKGKQDEDTDPDYGPDDPDAEAARIAKDMAQFQNIPICSPLILDELERTIKWPEETLSMWPADIKRMTDPINTSPKKGKHKKGHHDHGHGHGHHGSSKEGGHGSPKSGSPKNSKPSDHKISMTYLRSWTAIEAIVRKIAEQYLETLLEVGFYSAGGVGNSVGNKQDRLQRDPDVWDCRFITELELDMFVEKFVFLLKTDSVGKIARLQGRRRIIVEGKRFKQRLGRRNFDAMGNNLDVDDANVEFLKSGRKIIEERYVEYISWDEFRILFFRHWGREKWELLRKQSMKNKVWIPKVKEGRKFGKSGVSGGVFGAGSDAEGEEAAAGGAGGGQAGSGAGSDPKWSHKWGIPQDAESWLNNQWAQFGETDKYWDNTAGDGLGVDDDGLESLIKGFRAGKDLDDSNHMFQNNLLSNEQIGHMTDAQLEKLAEAMGTNLDGDGDGDVPLQASNWDGGGGGDGTDGAHNSQKTADWNSRGGWGSDARGDLSWQWDTRQKRDPPVPKGGERIKLDGSVMVAENGELNNPGMEVYEQNRDAQGTGPLQEGDGRDSVNVDQANADIVTGNNARRIDMQDELKHLEDNNLGEDIPLKGGWAADERGEEIWGLSPDHLAHLGVWKKDKQRIDGDTGKPIATRRSKKGKGKGKGAKSNTNTEGTHKAEVPSMKKQTSEAEKSDPNRISHNKRADKIEDPPSSTTNSPREKQILRDGSHQAPKPVITDPFNYPGAQKLETLEQTKLIPVGRRLGSKLLHEIVSEGSYNPSGVYYSPAYRREEDVMRRVIDQEEIMEEIEDEEFRVEQEEAAWREQTEYIERHTPKSKRKPPYGSRAFNKQTDNLTTKELRSFGRRADPPPDLISTFDRPHVGNLRMYNLEKQNRTHFGSFPAVGPKSREYSGPNVWDNDVDMNDSELEENARLGMNDLTHGPYSGQRAMGNELYSQAGYGSFIENALVGQSSRGMLSEYHVRFACKTVLERGGVTKYTVDSNAGVGMDVPNQGKITQGMPWDPQNINNTLNANDPANLQLSSSKVLVPERSNPPPGYLYAPQLREVLRNLWHTQDEKQIPCPKRLLRIIQALLHHPNKAESNLYQEAVGWGKVRMGAKVVERIKGRGGGAGYSVKGDGADGADGFVSGGIGAVTGGGDSSQQKYPPGASRIPFRHQVIPKSTEDGLKYIPDSEKPWVVYHKYSDLQDKEKERAERKRMSMKQAEYEKELKRQQTKQKKDLKEITAKLKAEQENLKDFEKQKEIAGREKRNSEALKKVYENQINELIVWKKNRLEMEAANRAMDLEGARLRLEREMAEREDHDEEELEEEGAEGGDSWDEYHDPEFSRRGRRRSKDDVRDFASRKRGGDSEDEEEEEEEVSDRDLDADALHKKQTKLHEKRLKEEMEDHSFDSTDSLEKAGVDGAQDRANKAFLEESETESGDLEAEMSPEEKLLHRAWDTVNEVRAEKEKKEEEWEEAKKEKEEENKKLKKQFEKANKEATDLAYKLEEVKAHEEERENEIIAHAMKGKSDLLLELKEKRVTVEKLGKELEETSKELNEWKQVMSAPLADEIKRRPELQDAIHADADGVAAEILTNPYSYRLNLEVALQPLRERDLTKDIAKLEQKIDEKDEEIEQMEEAEKQRERELYRKTLQEKRELLQLSERRVLKTREKLKIASKVDYEQKGTIAKLEEKKKQLEEDQKQAKKDVKDLRKFSTELMGQVKVLESQSNSPGDASPGADSGGDGKAGGGRFAAKNPRAKGKEKSLDQMLHARNKPSRFNREGGHKSPSVEHDERESAATESDGRSISESENREGDHSSPVQSPQNKVQNPTVAMQPSESHSDIVKHKEKDLQPIDLTKCARMSYQERRQLKMEERKQAAARKAAEKEAARKKAEENEAEKIKVEEKKAAPPLKQAPIQEASEASLHLDENHIVSEIRFESESEVRLEEKKIEKEVIVEKTDVSDRRGEKKKKEKKKSRSKDSETRNDKEVSGVKETARTLGEEPKNSKARAEPEESAQEGVEDVVKVSLSSAGKGQGKAGFLSLLRKKGIGKGVADQQSKSDAKGSASGAKEDPQSESQSGKDTGGKPAQEKGPNKGKFIELLQAKGIIAKGDGKAGKGKAQKGSLSKGANRDSEEIQEHESSERTIRKQTEGSHEQALPVSLPSSCSSPDCPSPLVDAEANSDNSSSPSSSLSSLSDAESVVSHSDYCEQLSQNSIRVTQTVISSPSVRPVRGGLEGSHLKSSEGILKPQRRGDKLKEGSHSRGKYHKPTRSEQIYAEFSKRQAKRHQLRLFKISDLVHILPMIWSKKEQLLRLNSPGHLQNMARHLHGLSGLYRGEMQGFESEEDLKSDNEDDGNDRSRREARGPEGVGGVAEAAPGVPTEGPPLRKHLSAGGENYDDLRPEVMIKLNKALKNAKKGAEAAAITKRVLLEEGLLKEEEESEAALLERRNKEKIEAVKRAVSGPGSPERNFPPYSSGMPAQEVVANQLDAVKKDWSRFGVVVDKAVGNIGCDFSFGATLANDLSLEDQNAEGSLKEVEIADHLGYKSKDVDFDAADATNNPESRRRFAYFAALGVNHLYVVGSVTPDSFAEFNDIRVGDVLLSVNGIDVNLDRFTTKMLQGGLQLARGNGSGNGSPKDGGLPDPQREFANFSKALHNPDEFPADMASEEDTLNRGASWAKFVAPPGAVGNSPMLAESDGRLASQSLFKDSFFPEFNGGHASPHAAVLTLHRYLSSYRPVRLVFARKGIILGKVAAVSYRQRRAAQAEGIDTKLGSMKKTIRRAEEELFGKMKFTDPFGNVEGGNSESDDQKAYGGPSPLTYAQTHRVHFAKAAEKKQGEHDDHEKQDANANSEILDSPKNVTFNDVINTADDSANPNWRENEMWVFGLGDQPVRPRQPNLEAHAKLMNGAADVVRSGPLAQGALRGSTQGFGDNRRLGQGPGRYTSDRMNSLMNEKGNTNGKGGKRDRVRNNFNGDVRDQDRLEKEQFVGEDAFRLSMERDFVKNPERLKDIADRKNQVGIIKNVEKKVTVAAPVSSKDGLSVTEIDLETEDVSVEDGSSLPQNEIDAEEVDSPLATHAPVGLAPRIVRARQEDSVSVADDFGYAKRVRPGQPVAETFLQRTSPSDLERNEEPVAVPTAAPSAIHSGPPSGVPSKTTVVHSGPHSGVVSKASSGSESPYTRDTDSLVSEVERATGPKKKKSK